MNADGAGDAAAAAAKQPGDEYAVEQLHAFGLERAAHSQENSESAAFRIHDAGEVEAAGRPALVGAGVVAAELHADGFEVLQPRVRVRQHLAHQNLVGDAVVAGHDLAQDAVEIVIGVDHDLPGVGERGVAGAADQPGIHQRDRVPGGPCRLALSAASRPPAPPPITSTSVSMRVPSSIGFAMIFPP